MKPLAPPTRSALRRYGDLNEIGAGPGFRKAMAKVMKRSARHQARIEISYELIPEVEVPRYSLDEEAWLDSKIQDPFRDYEIDLAYANGDLNYNDLDDLWRRQRSAEIELAEYLNPKPDPTISAWMAGELAMPDDGTWSDSYTLEFIQRRRQPSLSPDTLED